MAEFHSKWHDWQPGNGQHDQDTTHQRHLATTVVQSQGWRELVMMQVLTRAAQLDHLAVQPQLEAHMRLEAIARKDELLGLAKHLYKLAALPNPFEVAREGLYTALLPPPSETPPSVVHADQPLWTRKPRVAGTVA